jgi:nitric oxide reductase subunit B
LAAEQGRLRSAIMKYQSQKIALTYFSGAMLLFILQVVAGLWAGYIYVSPIFFQS